MIRRQRGSVAVFALIMITSTAALAITLLALTSSVRTKQTRLENDSTINEAYDGAADYIHDLAIRGLLRPPETIKIDIGKVAAEIVVTEATSKAVELARKKVTPSIPTLHLEMTFTYKEKTYRRQKVIGRGRLTTIWQYAIYSHSGMTTARTVTTGSTGLEGDAWFGGSITFLSLGTRFGGDLTSTGIIFPPTLAVTGKKSSSATGIDFPTVSRESYLAAASTKLADNSAIKGYIFVSSSGDGYPLLFVDGAATLEGNFSGTGVVYVDKDLTISGDITTGVGDHLLIICNGNVRFDDDALNIDAYIYCAKELRVDTSGKVRTFTSGIATNTIRIDDSVSASFDPWIRDNPLEAYGMKLPGEWP